MITTALLREEQSKIIEAKQDLEKTLSSLDWDINQLTRKKDAIKKLYKIVVECLNTYPITTTTFPLYYSEIGTESNLTITNAFEVLIPIFAKCDYKLALYEYSDSWQKRSGKFGYISLKNE